MATKEVFDTWYSRAFLHLCGIIGLIVLPISLPINIGFIIWAHKYGKYCTNAMWRFLGAMFKFYFSHDIDQFCDEIDVYEYKLDRVFETL